MNYEFELTEDNLKEALKSNLLNRNTKINNLLKLVNNLSRNTIITIDGAWGTGKTVFVKQIETLSKSNLFSEQDIKTISGIDKVVLDKFNENHAVYYYNSWENDLHKDPLQSILLFLLNELPKNKDIIVDFNKLKKMLPSHMLKIAGGIGSGVLTGINDKIEKTIGINCKKTIGATVDLVKGIEDLEDYESLAENIITINEVKEAINNLIDNLIKEDKKVVIIIDELDRCRPDFAVQLLEVITHFYNNDKLIFLVSSNNEQLSHTVSKFYGTKFDGYGYLNKMFNFIITLEKINPVNYAQMILNTSLSSQGKWKERMWLAVIEYNDFSMREMGRYLYYQEILEKYYNTIEIDDIHLMKYVFLPYCFGLKLKDIAKYNDFLIGNGINEFINGIFENNICKDLVEDILDNDRNPKLIKVGEEAIKLDEYVKNIYASYFNGNLQDKYRVQQIKNSFVDILSLISDYSKFD